MSAHRNHLLRHACPDCHDAADHITELEAHLGNAVGAIIEAVYSIAYIEGQAAEARALDAAADEIKRLRAVCGAMNDPSRTSRFEWNEDLTMVRTVTTTAWRIP